MIIAHKTSDGATQFDAFNALGDLTANRPNILVVVRHGESLYNREGRFTGWSDVGLSEVGRVQSRHVAKSLHPSTFDVIFTSDLERCLETARIILSETVPEAKRNHLASIRTPALRGRNDGVLVGMDKATTARLYGNELAPIWRRSFHLKLPGGESLADVTSRVARYYAEEILPRVKAGKNIMVVTHGNTIRALLVAMGEHSPDTVTNVEVANGSVWKWEFHKGQKRGPHALHNY